MIMLYGIYSVVINKYQCETKSEDKIEKQIDEKMTEIVYKVNDMIPVEWDDLYINFEVDRTLSGGVDFFFKYNGEYHYFFYIPRDFGVSKLEFFEEYDKLFEKVQELKKSS